MSIFKMKYLLKWMSQNYLLKTLMKKNNNQKKKFYESQKIT